MGKLTMTALFLTAFLYAAWLVTTRRTPFTGEKTGKYQIFLLMTLYFMAWMGVTINASEAPATSFKNGTVVVSSDKAVESTSLKDAWSVLGMLNRHYIVAALGTDEEREAFKRDKARYDEVKRIFLEKAGDLYTKMNKLEYCEECMKGLMFDSLNCQHETPEQREDRLARYQEAKKEYEEHGKPYRKPVQEMQNHMTKTWWTSLGDEEKYLKRNRRLFNKAVAEECALGRLTNGAAAVLRMAYDNLEYHSRRVQATCYIVCPPAYKPRDEIGDSIRRIAGLAAEGNLDEGTITQARTEIARNITMLHRLGLESEYQLIPIEATSGQPQGYRTPPEMNAEVAEKMADPELIAAIDETADIIVRLAQEMPVNWGLRQKD